MEIRLNLIKTKIKRSLGIFIWILDFLIPKNERYMIFYSEPQYSDNSKAVFEQLLELNYGDKYQFIWAVEDPKKYTELSTYALFVKHKSIMGFWYFTRSKYIFSTHSFWTNKYIRGRQVFVNLWHGMPFKKIGLLEKGMFKNPHRNYDFMPVTSDLFRITMSKCFGSELESNYITGLPRNDYLFKGKDVLLSMGISKQFKKIILWMPTFRDSGHRKVDGKKSEIGLPILNTEDLISLNSYLDKMDMLLMIKLHPYQIKRLNEEHLTNILVFNDNDIPISYHLYNIIGVVDCLLTDYSSVFIDYLILNKPIGFVYDDIDEYSETRGFIFEDFKDYMPGMHIRSFNELIEFLENLHNNEDYYVNERKLIRDIFNKFKDKNNSIRVVKKLEELYFKE